MNGIGWIFIILLILMMALSNKPIAWEYDGVIHTLRIPDDSEFKPYSPAVGDKGRNTR